MNVILQKYGPPIAVIVLAVYLGWPPEKPMDLGPVVVRAKSVRWKASDLVTPTLSPVSNGNPFAKVLVKPNLKPVRDANLLVDAEPQESSGPSEADLQMGLKLGGIAKTDRHQWAVVNRDVCRVGDQVPVIGLVGVVATIRDIQDDHITVVTGDLVVKIQTQERKKTSASPLNAVASRSVSQVADQQDDEDDDKAESVSRDDDPSGPTDVKKRNSGDSTENGLIDAFTRRLRDNSAGI